MPKKQSTAARRARATVREDGTKYTVALRDAEAATDDDGEWSWGCGECGSDSAAGYRCDCPQVCDECGGDVDSGYGCDCYDDEAPAPVPADRAAGTYQQGDYDRMADLEDQREPDPADYEGGY